MSTATETFRSTYASQAAEVLGVPIEDVRVYLKYVDKGLVPQLFVQGRPASQQEAELAETAMRKILYKASAS